MLGLEGPGHIGAGNAERGETVVPERPGISHGGHYSARRIQQLVKEIAEDAGITKNVYPHILRKTIAQHLADHGMPIDHPNLL